MKNLASYLAVLLGGSVTVQACGPNFPNWMLDGGSGSPTAAPVARFADEIARMKLGPPAYRAKLAEAGYAAQTKDAEADDLRAALTARGAAAGAIDDILKEHMTRREEVMRVGAARDAAHQAGAPLTNIIAISVTAAPGLPAEFADYFLGVVAWSGGDTNRARRAWESLLQRPPAERHYKSTWAAYMLGRSWEVADGRRARKYYQMVRELAGKQFADSAGLTVASIGREARTHYLAHEWERAIELYLDQWNAGDPTALVSLRWTVSAALEHGNQGLRPLAKNPVTRRVITAYVIAGGFAKEPIDVDNPVTEAALVAIEKTRAQLAKSPKPGAHRFEAPVMLWLDAVEAVKVKDLEAAEMLALAAYQAGKPDMAGRWLEVAADTPATQWLRAKLLLREGQVNQAAALLARIIRQWPTVPPAGVAATNVQMMDSLEVHGWTDYDGEFSGVAAQRQVLGELGALQLARREYTEALDALLRSGFWMDAAYVAERVLTLPELQTYVDRHWPAETNTALAMTNGTEKLPNVGTDLRYLLARRLVRAQRHVEARAYYPAEWQRKHDELMAALKTGADTNLPPRERAFGMFQAAKITCWSGMELFGTEVEPDWRIHGGNYDYGVDTMTRMVGPKVKALRAAPDEINRAQQHQPEPAQRFHYRFQAAELAWRAAQLLPNNDNLTALILWQGGTWIKYQDPQAADRFYKALVNRCRKTELGAAADRQRWFPVLDGQGRVVERINKVPAE